MTLPEDHLELFVDKKKMAQVLTNIIGNAVKYSPEGGLISLRGEVVGDHFQVSVQDQGIGMTAEQVDRIFDKFFRADASNLAVGGTGLGMPIAKLIVEAHDGKIWVESKPGSGTTVYFRVPLGMSEV